eukprot:408746-Amphidinium_carterae.1
MEAKLGPTRVHHNVMFRPNLTLTHLQDTCRSTRRLRRWQHCFSQCDRAPPPKLVVVPVVTASHVLAPARAPIELIAPEAGGERCAAEGACIASNGVGVAEPTSLRPLPSSTLRATITRHPILGLRAVGKVC